MSKTTATSAAEIRPVSPPRLLENVYSDDQLKRMFQVVRNNGPWQLILAQHFDSPEEVMATLSGVDIEEGVEVDYDNFLTANFRGYFASNGTCLYPDEIEDCFLNSTFLDHARAYWKADYARPEHVLFNINGPCESHDPAHLDATQYRGIDMKNSPIWLMNTMSKSGLFNDWLMKKAQVITWNYQGTVGGGFTYWPEGILEPPRRIPAPMWNVGAVVQNEQMYHRGEANGPHGMRKPEGLTFDSLFEADPDHPEGWRITTDGEVIQRIPPEEIRFLVHWTAEVYQDRDELKKVVDHTDDLTHDKVIDMLLEDLRGRGFSVEEPSDPLHDAGFIGLLTRAYDPGAPRIYPPEAPGPARRAA